MKKIMIVLLVCSFFSCKQEDVYTNVELAFEQPSNFPEPHYNLSSNPITEKGFELGKKLFYEGKLSSDGVVSCAFCHQQKFAFTHHGHQLSHGVEDRVGTRNTPPIQNMAFQKQFSWDGAAFHLDIFPIIPITNPVEMDETVTNILEKLQQDAAYRKLFSQAFEDGEINADNTFKAMSQFMLMMVSANSKYDKYIRVEKGGEFSEQERKGLELFKSKCASCHTSDLFTDDAFRNNGLPINPEINDLGRMTVTLLEEDKYKFKVPSLRNIELTAPYMHDGRFGSLKSVLNFYATGVQETQNLDPILKNENGTIGIALNEQEKENIIAFLKTLTDEEFITDKRFAE
ncbi:cytochrome c peroxidase [Tenacibaculum mesophilum]|nr:cytochrome c peroxidase [Tenacibaculum mesophilum]SHF65148.1 cytochrome c peroxidase [Tenacibaculum mesophilum]|eukprot:TRINITY_DN4154_c0_g3_i4.p1 TRINITY_DN4154_c0_g3~~TRINITY_DN4154_c0_g3_i4.p1  ORF type:complete len:344 (+),score=54.52 TRINITY_DN4154_c0_g3_i4:610-1641(+)